jgi:HAD domain in Swiss Army Knife RNA repair proteins
MGLYAIDCPVCGKPFMWFSGNMSTTGQLCEDCVKKAREDMKVIFLDFDGVLNSQGSFLYESNRRKKFKEQNVKGAVNETLCNVCTANFQYVLDKYPEVKIVISSTWRELFPIDWLKLKLESYGIDSSRVIGVTPKSEWGDRGMEIKEWLEAHPNVSHYVAIDDNDWGISVLHTRDRFVQTTWEGGMTFEHALELDRKLSNTHIKKMKSNASGQEST